MNDFVTCPRCGVRLPGRLRALPDPMTSRVVTDHQATASCAAGAAAQQALASGLVRLLHFETVLSLTLRTDPAGIIVRRAATLRACGVTAHDLLTGLHRLTKAELKEPGAGTGSFTVTREAWAPLWAVAVVFSVAPDAKVCSVLRRGVYDSALRDAAQALVRVTLHAAIADSRTDMQGALRDFVEGVAP